MAATDLPASGPVPEPAKAAAPLPATVLDPAAPVPQSPTSPKVLWQTVAAFTVTVLVAVVSALSPSTFAGLGPVVGPLLYALLVAAAGYGTGYLVKDPIRDVGTRAIAEDAARTAATFVGRHFTGRNDPPTVG